VDRTGQASVKYYLARSWWVGITGIAFLEYFFLFSLMVFCYWDWRSVSFGVLGFFTAIGVGEPQGLEL